VFDLHVFNREQYLQTALAEKSEQCEHLKHAHMKAKELLTTFAGSTCNALVDMEASIAAAEDMCT
jgi:hypothetical protein